LPKLLKNYVPSLYKSGYNPQDVKALFDPVDFVIFNGMNNEHIKDVVFFDGPAYSKQREKTQKSIKSVIKNGNLKWQTLRIDEEDGKVK
jgi:predicted Holliday junction resolvase-like endonuclease